MYSEPPGQIQYGSYQYTLEQIILAERNVASATIKAEAFFADNNHNTVTISTTSQFGYDDNNNNNKIAYVVIENQVGPYDQANYYAGTNSLEGWGDKGSVVSTLFNDVARAIYDYNGISGSLPTVITAEEPYSYSHTITLPDNIQNKDNIEIVTLLIDGENGEIINADKTSVGELASQTMPITVTPVAGQILYQGEVPAYTWSCEMDNKVKPVFSGLLSVDVGTQTIKQGSLKLVDGDSFVAADYELVFAENITCTYYDITPASATAEITSEKSPVIVDGIDWYIGSVTVTAPVGFTIQENGSGVPAGESITVEGEGCHTMEYTLIREGGDSYLHTANIGIDLVAPIIDVQTDKLSFTLTVNDGEGSGIASVEIDGTMVTLANDGTYTATGNVGTHTCRVTDNVGHTSTSEFTLVPNYNDLYFEENDSVSLFSSTMTIQERETFVFTAEVEDGYDEETLVVEYKTGIDGIWTTLEAGDDGTYCVENVSADTYVRASVSPIKTPDALKNIGNGKNRIHAGQGSILIETAVVQGATVFMLDGKLLRKFELAVGSNSLYGFSAGSYIVRLDDGTTVKVVVQ